MKNFKVGQIVKVHSDFEIKSELSDTSIIVKKGDQAFIDSRGFVHYITGKARGKIQPPIKDVEVKGFDTESIATLVFKALNGSFDLKAMLEGYDIEQGQFISAIDDMLSDIL